MHTVCTAGPSLTTKLQSNIRTFLPECLLGPNRLALNNNCQEGDSGDTLTLVARGVHAGLQKGTRWGRACSPSSQAAMKDR